MSTEAYTAFVSAAKADRQMSANLTAAMGALRDQALTRTVARFAREHGYDVTDEDAAKALVEARARADGDRLLGDDELDSVAGGYFLQGSILDDFPFRAVLKSIG